MINIYVYIYIYYLRKITQWHFGKIIKPHKANFFNANSSTGVFNNHILWVEADVQMLSRTVWQSETERTDSNEERDLFRFLRAPCREEKGGELKEQGRKGEQKTCSIILILGCVCVTFGGMIVSHLGVWGVIFPPVWSHSPDLCKLAVKHIATRPSCLTHGLSIHRSWATAPLQVFRHFRDTHTEFGAYTVPVLFMLFSWNHCYANSDHFFLSTF